MYYGEFQSNHDANAYMSTTNGYIEISKECICSNGYRLTELPDLN